MVGDTDTGYIVVPHTGALRREFEECCRRTDRDPPLWVRVFTLNTNG